MKKIMITAFLVLFPALLQAAEGGAARPRWSLELKGGALFPDTSNWSRFYGSSYMGEFGGALAYKVHRQIEIGIEGSYSEATGKGHQPGHEQAGAPQPPSGKVTHQQAPLNLFVLGRAIFHEDQWVVPFAGGGWTRMFYKQKVEGQGSTRGSVNGYHVRGGVQLLLDRLEPESAKSFYQDFGVHHTYLLLEARYTDATADTISGGDANLGGVGLSGGLLLEF